MGVSAWWADTSPILVGPEMENGVSNLETKESSAVWDSNKGTSSGALCGAAKLDPVEQGAGGTSLTGEELPSLEGGLVSGSRGGYGAVSFAAP
jgi:hypothetical protein